MLQRCHLLSYRFCHVDIDQHHIIIVYRHFDIVTCLPPRLMYVSAHTHPRTHARTPTHMHTPTRTHARTRTHTHPRTRTHAHMHTHTHTDSPKQLSRCYLHCGISLRHMIMVCTAPVYCEQIISVWCALNKTLSL